MRLNDRAMIVSLHLSTWRGQRIDRKVTKEVLENKQAERDAGRFEKYLVPKTALEGIQREDSASRQAFYRLTLPWSNDGDRILASAAFFDFSAEMQQRRSARDLAIEAFKAAYPQYLAAAPTRLNGLYDATDFPSVTELDTKFGWSLDILPMPDVQDWRIGLGEEVEAELKAQAEEVANGRVAAAQRELWSRIVEGVKEFVTTMEDPEKVFHNTKVTKLVDAAKLAPKLSLTPDPALEALCGDLLHVLDGLDPQDLRKSKSIRADAARRASEALAMIEDQMAGAFAH